MYSTIHSPKEIFTYIGKEAYNMVGFRDKNFNDVSVYYEDRELTLKAGNIKKRIKLSTLFQALADAYNADEFYLEEVDEIVGGLQLDVEEIRGL